MKTKIPTLLCAALLVSGAMISPLARAAEGEGDAKPRMERREGGARGDRLAQLKEALGLTEEQIEKLKPILAAEREEIQALRKDAGEGADRSAMREKMQAIREKYKSQIEAVLTAEQKAKLAELEAKRPRGPRPEGADAPPPPPPAE